MGAGAGNAASMVFDLIGNGIAYGDTFVEEGRLTERTRYNQNLARVAERDVRNKGNYDAGLQRMAGAQMAAKQKVAYANSGVDSTVGTPAEVMASTRQISEMDAQQIQNNAAREAWGLQVKRDQMGQELSDAKRKLEQKRTSTLLTMFSDLIGGGASVAGAGAKGGG